MELLNFSETLDMGTVGQIWGWWGRYGGGRIDMGVVGQVNGRIGTQEAAKTRGHRKHALGAMQGNRAEGERSRWQ